MADRVPVDEGRIHEWLDGQLDVEAGAQLERLVAEDPAWADALAEARGLIAASRRITRALDEVPGDVLPRVAAAAAVPTVAAARAALEPAAETAARAEIEPTGKTAARAEPERVAPTAARAAARRPQMTWWRGQHAAALLLDAGGSALVARLTRPTTLADVPTVAVAAPSAPAVDSVAAPAAAMAAPSVATADQSSDASAQRKLADAAVAPRVPPPPASPSRAQEAPSSAPMVAATSRAESMTADRPAAAAPGRSAPVASEAVVASAEAARAQTGDALNRAPADSALRRTTRAASEIADAAVAAKVALGGAEVADAPLRRSAAAPPTADERERALGPRAAQQALLTPAPRAAVAVSLDAAGGRCLEALPLRRERELPLAVTLDTVAVGDGQFAARWRRADAAETAARWQRRRDAVELVNSDNAALGALRGIVLRTAAGDTVTVRWITCVPQR